MLRLRSYLKLASSILAILSLCAVGAAQSQSRSFVVRASDGGRIRFTSDAPLETMTGTSRAVSGEFTADPTNLAAARGFVEVPVASLRTGIELRDEHLRSDAWLDAARFPNARFEVQRVTAASAATPGQELPVTFHGRFTLHGRTQDVTARGRIRWAADASGGFGDHVEIRARFSVHLANHGISIPSVVQLKVAEDIAVDVRLVARVGG